MAIITTLFIGCSDDDDDKYGQVSLEITDAPSDDENIQATFITVSMLKIDGEAVEGFEKQTINISNYQNGETKQLFSSQAKAQSYSDITIELDFESDVSGNSPGCYVLTSDNEKHNLAASSDTQMEITFDKDFSVEEGQSTDLVIDFDLRKSITRNEGNSETDYSFVSDAGLKSSLRLVESRQAGAVAGEIQNNASTDLEYIVYVYEEGEYNFISETQGQGTDNVMFAKAVTSAKVEEDGTYTLAFLEEGDYEIHIASYSRTTAGGWLNFTGMANAVSIMPSLTLDEISVSPDVEVELDISIAVSV